MAQDQADPAEQAAPASMAHDPYSVLRDPNFRRFMLAGMAATIGNQMQSVAVGWELYERTRSPLALGMVGLAQVLPVLLLAIPSGHAADRYSRKAQIVLAHLLLLATSAGLALLSARRGPVGLTYLLPDDDGRRPGDEPAGAVGDPPSDRPARALALGRDLEHQHLADRRDGRPRAREAW